MSTADPPRTSTPDDRMRAVTARAGYMMGANVADWPPRRAAAWEGLLEVARRMRRDAETMLEERHELSVSMLGIMGRLVLAPRRTLRQTELADAMGLSLSRISRIIDLLEARGLVERRRCPVDARATNVRLSRRGATVTRAAQDTTHEYVRRAFTDRLTEDEIATLAAVFTRLVGGEPEAG